MVVVNQKLIVKKSFNSLLIFLVGLSIVCLLVFGLSLVHLIPELYVYSYSSFNLALFLLSAFSGIVTFYLTKAHDKAKSTKTEHQKIDNNQAFYDLLERVPEGIIISNDLGEIVFINQKAKDIFWYNHEEIKGRYLNYLVPETEEEGEILAAINKCLNKDGYLADVEVFAKRGDNFYFPASITISPLQCNNKNPLVVLSVNDMSLQKLDEERLKLQHFSIDHATDAVLWIDRHGQILYANETACNTMGYSALEMSLLNVTDLTLETEELDWTKLWNVAVEYNSCVFETLLNVQSGEAVPVEVVVNYVNVDNQEYLCAFMRNISIRKLDEQQLEAYASELERKNEELEQIGYITSHSLQEPLRNISSFVQLLNMRYKGQLDNDADEFISYVVDGVERMQYLLRDLSRYSKLNIHAPSFELFESKDALHTSIRNLEKCIQKHKVQINYDTQFFPKVRGAKKELVQLFQQLLSNSIKYSGEQSVQINVGVEKRGAYWAFYVKDNGIGIDPEYSKKIFKIFNRLHNNYKEIEGTGIGLAICQKIVEKHGGTIWVESEVGKGATFYFTLPLAIKHYEKEMQKQIA